MNVEPDISHLLGWYVFSPELQADIAESDAGQEVRVFEGAEVTRQDEADINDAAKCTFQPDRQSGIFYEFEEPCKAPHDCTYSETSDELNNE